MPVSEEHVQLLKRQMALVQSLRDVVASQQRALEQLGDATEDYDNVVERVCGELDSDDEAENDQRQREIAAAGAKEPFVNWPIDEVELRVPNIDYSEPTAEDEKNFSMSKPWLGAIAPPSRWSWEEAANRDAEPNVKLELEHVYGYHARSWTNNVVRVDNDTVVYPAAKLVVVHSIASNKQQFFSKHDGDVVSIAYCPARRMVASAQQGRSGAIHLWNVDDPTKTIASLAAHRRAVRSLDISPDGSRLISVGADDENTLVVHDVAHQNILAMVTSGTNDVTTVKWNTSAGNDPVMNFVTAGPQHLKFWSFSGGSCTYVKPLFGRRGELQTFHAIQCTVDYVIVTTDKGQLYAFQGTKLKKVIEAHNAPCLCLVQGNKGSLLYSGGRDGFVCVWDAKSLKSVNTIDMNLRDNCYGINHIRALWADDLNPDTVIVGTITSSIYEVAVMSGRATTLVSGHFGDLAVKGCYGEVWGLACNPVTPSHVITCGEDCSVRLWDTNSRRQLCRASTSEHSNCAAYSPDGKYCAVGMDNGGFSVFSASDLTLVASVKRAKRRIMCIRYSPCGRYLAVGDADCKVNIYKVQGETYSFHVCCAGNSSVVLRLDFSTDSKYIQTCSQAYELLFYEVEVGQGYAAGRDLKDVRWSTHSSILGWPVQGVWPKNSDGSEVNAVSRSPDGRLLVSCESGGAVKVFNYPCVGSGLDKRGNLGRRPACIAAVGHSDQVAAAEFNKDQTFLFSVGATDNCLFQWKVIRSV